LGSSPAQFNLARLYEKKVGFDKNLKLAQYWYEKAAIQSNADAQYYLADFFERTAKPMQALLMYQKSAEQGFSKAQSRLARRRVLKLFVLLICLVWHCASMLL
jgi:TPR repeat protein